MKKQNRTASTGSHKAININNNTHNNTNVLPNLKKYPQSEYILTTSYNDDVHYYYYNEHTNNTNEHNNNVNPPSSYVERLELKIQEQAKRLHELMKYKCLCEKRLLQFNPNESLPLTESIISQHKKKNNNNIASVLQYNELYDKYNTLLNDYNLLLSSFNDNCECSLNKPAENKDQTYTELKHKNKELENEKNKVIELLRQETLNNEEQKNLIAILQQTIDNDLIKTNTINQYITHDNVIDFIKLKNESENYRKQLVLSQALINSLKAEIDNLHRNNTKPKEQQPIPKDNDVLLEDNLKLKTKITSQKEIISSLSKENSHLKSLIEEAETKITQNYNLNSETTRKVISLENDNANHKQTINEYELKFDYFNEYISNIKHSLSKTQKIIQQYITMYNKMANDDLNSLLTKTFSDNILTLLTKSNQLSNIEKYSLDINDIQLHNVIITLVNIVNNEFMCLYEKLFESNDYSKESAKTILDLESKVKLHKKDNESISELKCQVDSLVKENATLQQVIDDSKNKNIKVNDDNMKLQMNVEGLRNAKNQLIHLTQVVMRIIRKEDKYNGMVLLYQEAVSICESIMKLRNEQSNVKLKIDGLMNSKGCVSKDDNYELEKMVEKEKNTLVQLYNELDVKIKEKEKRISDIKNEMKSKVDVTHREEYSKQTYIEHNNNNTYDANLTDYDFEEQHNKINNVINYYNNGMFDSQPISMNNTTLTTNGNPLNQMTYNLLHKH